MFPKRIDLDYLRVLVPGIPRSHLGIKRSVSCGVLHKFPEFFFLNRFCGLTISLFFE